MSSGVPGDGFYFQVLEGWEIFLPRMFQGFPEIKEALISNQIQAAFIVAPLAIALRSQGVPIKITVTAAPWWSKRTVRSRRSRICEGA